jgi:hypothetical protein
MLDENIWMQLSIKEKTAELQSYIDQLLAIENNEHELSNTREQGKLPTIRKELEKNIFKIIELENAT